MWLRILCKGSLAIVVVVVSICGEGVVVSMYFSNWGQAQWGYIILLVIVVILVDLRCGSVGDAFLWFSNRQRQTALILASSPHRGWPCYLYNTTGGLAPHCPALHYTKLYWTKPYHTEPNYIALRCTTLHNISLQYTTLQCTDLHQIALHCNPLHNTTLHC